MLKDKRILVISPQPWGEMHVSKHHYALELARRNNKVVFLNPMALGQGRISIDFFPVVEVSNLLVAKVTLPIPASLRFKWRILYDWLIDLFAPILAKRMGGFDIVWCFDPNYFHNLKKLARIAIYHPVDPIVERFQIDCGKEADVIFSVSDQILKAFENIRTPRYLINHGISGAFRSLAVNNYKHIESFFYKKPPRLRFGYVGNLLRKEIDWQLIYRIIEQNPEVEFNFWGPNGFLKSNLAGDQSKSTLDKIGRLSTYSNVMLHGIIASDKLPGTISQMDGFLLIYKYLQGQSDRSNSHKILEFFCTGKTLVSFRVKAYEELSDLLVMPKDDNDDEIPRLFSEVVKHIETYNNRSYAERRLSFALSCSYESNLSRIEKILVDLCVI